jgi:alpha-tubulin suppressor-like RCC1 family protein
VGTAPASLGITFRSVEAGRDFSCGLDTQGTAYCWDGFPGRPVVVSGSVTFASLAVRAGHGCGLTQDGAAYCWGDNTYGQVGHPAGTYIGAPAAVDSGLTYRVIAVGLYHTCAVTTAGALYCWGANDQGQVGLDSVPVPCDVGNGPTDVPCAPAPLPVRPDLRFVSLSAGDNHTCGITTDSTAYCWGQGEAGELGDGAAQRSTPTAVSGGLKFIAVSAGGRHSCGVSSDHDAWCWGSNTDLQLGSLGDDGGCAVSLLRCTAVPVAVVGGLKFDSVTTSQAVPYAGDGPVLGGHSCGLTPAGLAYCWGLNEEGQLGASQDLRSYTPVLSRGDTTFVQISAGETHTCGLTPSGEIHCWDHLSPQP